MFQSYRSFAAFFLPLVLYAGITYCAELWWLYSFFCVSCFYTLFVVVNRAEAFHKRSRYKPVIVWYLFLQNRNVFFVWILCAAVLMMLPCLVVLFEFCSWAPSLGALYIVGYATLCIVIIVAALLIVSVVVHKPLLRIVLWSSIFVAWWWFIDTLFFISVGVPCGYVIVNPLLCCAASKHSCLLVQAVGIYGFLALSLVAAGGSVAWYLYNSRASGILALLLLAFLGGEFFCFKTFLPSCLLPLAGETEKEQETVPWNHAPWKHICAFKCTGYEKGVLESALVLHKQFLACCARAVVPDLIIGPESCLPCALNNEPSLCALLGNDGSCSSPLVLLGSRREEEVKNCIATSSIYNTHKHTIRRGNHSCCHNAKKNTTTKCFNTAFIIQQGRIIYHYDKLFPVPFLEASTKNFCKRPFLYDFFSKKQKVVRERKATQEKDGALIQTVEEKESSFGERESNFFFSKGKPPYTAGKTQGNVMILLDGVMYAAQIALCSDFFCTKIFDTKVFDTQKISPVIIDAKKMFRDVISPQNLLSFEKSNLLGGKPLLIVLTHDSWFYGTSVAVRMHRYAVLWAVRHKIPVLYVGNCYASWIEPSGRIWPLATADS